MTTLAPARWATSYAARYGDDAPWGQLVPVAEGTIELERLDDPDLARLAADGDADAFAALYRRHVQQVHAFILRRSGSRDLAEEVTSATFERALQAIGSFRWTGSGIGAWLFRIASNELMSVYRRQGRGRSGRAQHAVLELSGHGTAEAADESWLSTLGDERMERMLDALSTLRPRYQEAISLRYLAGLGHDEAAAALGVSKPVMAVLVHRALASLRRAMERQERTSHGERGVA